MLKRTLTCGDPRLEQVDQIVVLNGWVNRRRDHGGLIFVDLRDRYGLTQVVFDPQSGEDLMAAARKLGLEDVIAVRGKIRRRPENAVNREMATGTVELLAIELEILNEARPQPFLVTDRKTGLEDLRLKYRYLDLRTRELQRNIAIRHKTYQSVRNFYYEHNFYEIETPFLTRSTPEGARDFLVPSRLCPGHFYALPQSPQQYKQILMVAGFDRYFQIVRCFRDEDLRADRQPEFTQIDVEMSFVDEEDVLQSTEAMLIRVFCEVAGIDLESPFLRIPYDEAMRRYGSDKPDLRFGHEIHTLDEIAGRSEFEVFKKAHASGGTVAGICFPQGASITRKIIDELTEQVKKMGVQGLAFTRVTATGLEGGIARFLEPVTGEILTEFNAHNGDIIFFIADTQEKTYPALGILRLEIAKRLQLIPANVFKPVWVTRFPLLEWSTEENRLVAMHHPFTAAVPEEADLLATDPARVHARAYDIVINGHEIGGGSIRNHTVEMQKRMFDVLQINPETAQEKFGFLLEALSYGAPPHGGIALGFDRLVMLLAGADNLREVIAFPKTTSGASLMDGSPARVEEQQLQELGLKLIKSS
ncbi:MAG TPA: aspartate--tRNA ligase [Candidatus Marinimicrobia bacterium]|nr:aspartate--tRNA ligase [Candidatus Neomarinimicrobiota bacterium]HRS51951.1 aspartate--tRNA ligase [Candidatus Neomarinimicrobiota bacterium]HRU91920.1 aspartate--tRNA ligase [Candidatus Neomarinimicrobiota bacterium]